MDLTKVVVASTVENPILVGVKRWAMEYNEQWRKEEDVTESIKTYMVQFDKKVAEAKKVDEEMGEPDEDGWVTVTRQDKKKAASSKLLLPPGERGENGQDSGIKEKI